MFEIDDGDVRILEGRREATDFVLVEPAMSSALLMVDKPVAPSIGSNSKLAIINRKIVMFDLFYTQFNDQ